MSPPVPEASAWRPAPRGLLPVLLMGALLAALTAHAQTARLHGSDYLALQAVAGNLGMERAWLKPGEEQRLKSEWTTLLFDEHKRHFTLNGVQVFIGKPIVAHAGDLWISQKDYEYALAPILTPQVFKAPPKLYHIVLDPGHGGRDPGAENRSLGVNEKLTTLDVAFRLKRMLEDAGYKVTLTREDDRAVGLRERPALANRLNADLFVSLHFNAAGDSRVSGVETFIYTLPWQPSTARGSLHRSDKRTYPANASDAWNALAGYYVQSSLVRELGARDRGLRRARFAVLEDLRCPGMLVEGGFLSNRDEAGLIKTPQYREKIAHAIARGIFGYQKVLNRIRQRS